MNIEYAINNFEEYLKNYDVKNEKIRLKITHTYGVMKISEYISKDLKLSDEDGLEDKELLHAKIIRDADKTDNFRVKEKENFKSILNFKKEELENDYISEEIYNDFINNEIVLDSKRRTGLDIWVSHLAYIFDFNFS